MEIPAAYKGKTAQEVYKVLVEVIGSPEIPNDAVLCACDGWCSDLMDEVDYMDFMRLLEDRFGLVISGEDAEKLKVGMVSGLIRYLENGVEKTEATS